MTRTLLDLLALLALYSTPGVPSPIPIPWADLLAALARAMGAA